MQDDEYLQQFNIYFVAYWIIFLSSMLFKDERMHEKKQFEKKPVLSSWL